MKANTPAIAIPENPEVRKALSEGCHAHHTFAVYSQDFIDSGAFFLYSSKNSSHYLYNG